MIVLKKKNDGKNSEEFLIPKKQSYNHDSIIKITIDYDNMVFKAKKIESVDNIDLWEKNEDFTFATSILSRFLKNCK